MKSRFSVVIIFFFAAILHLSAATAVLPVSIVNNGQPSIASIKLFPNPTTQFFQIYEDQDVAKISVYSLVGKEILTTNHESGDRYDVSEYRNGIYLVRLIDSNGEVIKVLRLSKR